MTTERSLGQTYLNAARHRLAACVKKIKNCLDQLNDHQVWWRPQDSMNSIANMMLHLCGNVRQWLVAGIGGARTSAIGRRSSRSGRRSRKASCFAAWTRSQGKPMLFWPV